MFLDSNSSISRISRQLWPLPTFIIPSALVISFIANLTGLTVVLFVVQIIASAIV